MRSELERMQLIEKYLQGALSSEEQAAFEDELKQNPDFQKEIDAQKALIEGTKRLGIKAKISKSFKAFRRKQKLWKWGLGGALTITALAIIIPLAVDNTEQSNSSEIGLDADQLEYKATEESFESLNKQVFEINTHSDTVISTEEGLVFAIPEQAFMDEDGDVIDGIVKVTIREAMNPSQIIGAGLSTTSNGKLLETGGMFYIGAKQNEEQLYLKKEIYAEVPAEEHKPGMQLFDGVRQKDGTINWVNPKKIEKWITPVEITLLDFYPPGYENKLNELGYGNKSKAWKDSLYYSFANEEEAGEEYMFTADSVGLENAPEKLQINPAKIAAIWNKNFNNTNLATKEFEERLKVIFSTCKDEVLDVYVNNLDRNFWELDSMAAALCEGKAKEKFLEFSKRKDGRVRTDNNMINKLGKFYEKRQKELQKEVQKLQRQHSKQLEEARKKFNTLTDKQQKQEAKRKQKNFDKEFNKNLKEVNKQLGIKAIRVPVVLATLGPKNVDRYVEDVVKPTFAATQKRSSQTIQYEGKTARIEYTPFYLELENKESYDRVYAYLMSNELYSFQRMRDTVGGYTEKLNGFLDYYLAVVAYKGDSAFFSSQKALDKSQQRLKVQLTPIAPDKLETALNALSPKKSFARDIKRDQTYELKKETYQKSVQKEKEMLQMRYEIRNIIFPCGKEDCGWFLQRTIGPNDCLHSLALYLGQNGSTYIYDEKLRKDIVGNWQFNNNMDSIIFYNFEILFEREYETFPILWIEGRFKKFLLETPWNCETLEGNTIQMFFQEDCGILPFAIENSSTETQLE